MYIFFLYLHTRVKLLPGKGQRIVRRFTALLTRTIDAVDVE